MVEHLLSHLSVEIRVLTLVECLSELMQQLLRQAPAQVLITCDSPQRMHQALGYL